MNEEDDDLSYLRAMIEKKRKINGYWDWPDRPIKEIGIARNILQRAGEEIIDLVNRNQGEDPPDCEATLQGQFSGVEVTELIDQETLEQSISGGTKVFLDWDREQFLAALRARIDAKDRPWKGGPYTRYVLVIHTDELVLSDEKVEQFLQGVTFHCRRLTDVILGLSYHPGKGDPVFRLTLSSHR